ncbi:MAG TPA: hypothetical protein PLM75_08840, partial [bacterium]|nr:hypothetical protein [bacterium]
MKEKILYKIKVVFYSALVISIVLNTIIYFWNLYIKKVNNNVSLCMQIDIANYFDLDDTAIQKVVNDYEELFKEYKIFSVLFRKFSIEDLIKNGYITVKNGYEILDDFKSQGIVNPYIYLQIKNKNIKPQYTYIFAHNQNLFVKLLPALENALKNYKVAVFADSKFQYDGDISYNYIIEINTLKENIIEEYLFYPDELIKKFYEKNIHIALLDPDFLDIQQIYDFRLTAVIAKNTITEITDFKKISPTNLTIVFDDNRYYAFNYPNKEKYLAITDTLIKRKNIFYKKLFSNYYQMLIYVPINKSKEKIANDLLEINNFLKENNLKLLKHSEIKRVSFFHMDTFLFIINTLIILSFYLILSLKDERLLFIGYLGVFLAFTIYMLKIQFLTSKMIVWAMGGIQIIAIQIFFSIIGNKKIENIVKGIILVFAFYYLSVISTGEYMYSLLNIPDLAKNIMIIFQLLSFIFGLYFIV